MSAKQNIIGPQVRKLRYEQDLTQGQLAAKCNVLGLDISRGTLSKIEAQVRQVTDAEVQILAKALRTKIEVLFVKPSN